MSGGFSQMYYIFKYSFIEKEWGKMHLFVLVEITYQNECKMDAKWLKNRREMDANGCVMAAK